MLKQNEITHRPRKERERRGEGQKGEKCEINVNRL